MCRAAAETGGGGGPQALLKESLSDKWKWNLKWLSHKSICPRMREKIALWFPETCCPFLTTRVHLLTVALGREHVVCPVIISMLCVKAMVYVLRGVKKSNGNEVSFCVCVQQTPCHWPRSPRESLAEKCWSEQAGLRVVTGPQLSSEPGRKAVGV